MIVKANNLEPPQNDTSLKISPCRTALPQILAVMVKNMLLMSYGMTIGYPTLLIPGLSSKDPEETFHLNADQISWIGSINSMCVPLGCLFSGAATQPLGRKRAMQIISLPFVICWLIFKYSFEVWHVYLALSMTGLFGGLIEAPVLTYVAEITQPHLRGMLSATSTLSIILGILIQFILGTFLHWRTVAFVSAIFPLISFCLLCLVPESPYWLVMDHQMDRARESLAWLRGWTNLAEIEPEMQEICLTQNHKQGIENPAFNDAHCTLSINRDVVTETTKPKSIWKTKLENSKNFFKKSFIWPFALVSFIYFLGGFAGFWTLQTYAVTIFATLEVPIDKYHATVFLGVAEFVGTIISVVLVRNVGKRVMAFISLTGLGISHIVIATYAYITNIEYVNIARVAEKQGNTNPEGHQWIPLVFLILIAFTSHCGIKSLPWILIGEIFSNQTRATGCGLASGISYVFSFLANKIFLQMIAFLTLPGVYWFHSSLSFLGLIILYFILPETEGKTLLEITNHFLGVSKLGNHIQKKNKNNNINRTHNTSTNNKVEENVQTEGIESKL